MENYRIERAEEKFRILRNDLVIKTPLGKPLIVPSLGLAEMIIEELEAHCKAVNKY